MLTIRLTRKGKKNQPFFRVVVIDKRRSSKGGRAVEDLGYVDPLKKRKSFKKERILYWLSKGAQPSATIHNYLVSEKIIESAKINVYKKSKKAPEAMAQPAVPAGESVPITTESEKPAETPVEAKAEELKPELSPAPEEKLVEAQREEVKPVEELKPTEAEKPKV